MRDRLAFACALRFPAGGCTVPASPLSFRRANPDGPPGSNPLQFPHLRVPGADNGWQTLDVHLAEAVAGQLSPEMALESQTGEFEDTPHFGRE